MKARILIILTALLAVTVALGAQTTNSTASVTQPAAGPANVAGLLYASNFAHWTASPTQQGTSWSNPGQCFGTSGGVTFPLYSTSAPVTIVDLATSANTETVTPTLVNYSGSGCSVALPATHAHSNYYLKSGTAGLQEALNWAGAGNYVVILTPDWKTMGGTTGMITAAVAGANTTVLDMRTSTAIAYSGTTPTAGFTGTGKQVLQTSPTLITPVLGAATGTSVVLSSTSTSGGAVMTAVAPTVAAAQVGLGSTVAASSSCGTLATSAGCLVINVAGTPHYIPYY